jgi:hypothetical protein
MSRSKRVANAKPEASRPAPSDANDRAALRRVEARTELRVLARICGYLARGRLFAGLPAEALNAHCLEVYRALMADEDVSEEVVMDLRTEFDLRGMNPPSMPSGDSEPHD